VGFFASGLGGFLPEPMSDFVVIPALVFAGLSLLGMVWLPRPFLPRWYKVEMGMEGGSARNRVVVSASGRVSPPLSGPLGEDLGAGAETGFGAASTLSGFVGGVAHGTMGSHGSSSTGGPDVTSRPASPSGDARHRRSGGDADS
jgi:hypothetical protein